MNLDPFPFRQWIPGLHREPSLRGLNRVSRQAIQGDPGGQLQALYPGPAVERNPYFLELVRFGKVALGRGWRRSGKGIGGGLGHRRDHGTGRRGSEPTVAGPIWSLARPRGSDASRQSEDDRQSQCFGQIHHYTNCAEGGSRLKRFQCNSVSKMQTMHPIRSLGGWGLPECSSASIFWPSG